MAPACCGRDRSDRSPRRLSAPTRGVRGSARVAVWIPLLLAVSSLVGCQALDAPARLKNGPYAGVSMGASLEQFDLPTGLESETGFVGGAHVGYRLFDRRVAVEAAFDALPAVDIRVKSPRLDVGDVSGERYMGRLKAFTAPAPIQAYGLVGFGLVTLEVEETLGIGLSRHETELSVEAGVGLQFHSGEHWTLYSEAVWTLPSDELEDFQFLTVVGGFSYRF